MTLFKNYGGLHDSVPVVCMGKVRIQNAIKRINQQPETQRVPGGLYRMESMTLRAASKRKVLFISASG